MIRFLSWMRVVAEYDQAERFYKRALEVQEEASGADSGEAKEILAQYAELLRTLGRGEEAAKLEARIKETSKGQPSRNQ